MLTRFHESLCDDEAGQALVLGVLAMLVLALCVLTTAQLGRAIDQRVQVQNAADAVAYSSAVAVARSLNFIAWTNRAMVSQYVAAMAAQSMLALVDGLEAWIGTASDLLQTMAAIQCPLSAPGAAPLLAMSEALRQVLPAVRALSESMDGPVAQFVELVVALHRDGMKGAQLAMREATAAALADSSESGLARRVMTDIAGRTNAAELGSTYGALMAGNASQYGAMFDVEGSERIEDPGHLRAPYNHRGDDKGQRAERMMAELTNASRQPWEIASQLDPKASRFPAAVQASRWTKGAQVNGQTRLVNVQDASRFAETWGHNFVFSTGMDSTQSTRGPSLSSPVVVTLPGAKLAMVGVQSAHDRRSRLHCRYDGRRLIANGSCPAFAQTRPMRCVAEDRHVFEGMTPYLSFNLEITPDHLFNQRDYLALVHKTSRDAMLPNAAMGFGAKPLAVRWPTREARFTAPGFGTASMSGMHGWARSLAYYHRPGHWTEPPNLFNPFWKAKLGPVDREALLAKLPPLDRPTRDAIGSLP